MAGTKKRRISRPGTCSVFVGCRAQHKELSWKLNVREEPCHREVGCSDESASAKRNKGRLFHYIAAGGARQWQRTVADDLAEHRQRRLVIVLALLAVAWLVFYFMPYVG